jgi:uncharacterized phage protein gp47/JayE
MNLQQLLKSFDELVDMQVTAMQAASTTTLDFSVGSIELANVESNAGVVLSLEAAITYLYAYSRAITCASNDPNYNNPDLDSWMAQFKFPRLDATFATVNLTFSRTTTTQQAVIPIGAQVTTNVGNIIFAVTLDTLNPAYNASLNGYVIPIGQTSVTVPSQCTQAGTIGNVAANQITFLSTAIPYVDSVTNATAATNGENVENDQHYLTRFQLYINSLSKAVKAAIEAAIESVQDGILYNLLENQNYGLEVQYGFFTVIIDDGTGNPPDSLITAVRNIIYVTRGLTIQYDVKKTTPVLVPISANLVIDPSYDENQIVDAVTTALQSYVNNLDVGAPLEITKIPSVIYGVSKGILNIQNLLINNGTDDVMPSPIESVKTGTISLTTTNPN